MATSPRCCIFIPLHKPIWSPAEISSIIRCIHLLGDFHFYFGYKSDNDPDSYSLQFRDHLLSLRSWDYLPIQSTYLSSIKMYNRLMLSPWFYQFFVEWDYLLVFQPDAWILNGNLKYWLSKRYTYIGAPWCPALGPDKDCPITGVGNGGLSLRNIHETIRILSSPCFSRKPVLSARELADYLHLFKAYNMHSPYFKPIAFLARLFTYLTILTLYPFGFRNNLAFLAGDGMNEDIVLGYYSKRIHKWVRIPDVRIAARFSLESNASHIADAFSVDVPFGCHAWEKRDKTFFLNRYKSFFSPLFDDAPHSLS